MLSTEKICITMLKVMILLFVGLGGVSAWTAENENPEDGWIYFTVDSTDNALAESGSHGIYIGDLEAGTYTIEYVSGAITPDSKGPTWNRLPAAEWPGEVDKQGSYPSFLQVRCTWGLLQGFISGGYSTAAAAEAANAGSSITIEITGGPTYAWYVDDYTGDNSGSITYRISNQLIVDIEMDDLPEENDQDPPHETDPGAFIMVNDDDDDENGEEDRTQSTAISEEDDLRAIKLSCVPSDLEEGTLKLSASTSGIVKIWSSSTKTEEIVLPRTWDFGSEAPPQTLYVEGVNPGETTLTLSLSANGQEVTDEVKVTAIQMQFVIPASDYYGDSPNYNASPVPTEFVGVSNPCPTVTIGSTSVSLGSETCTVSLSNIVVRDPIADNVPRGGGADIEKIGVSVGSSEKSDYTINNVDAGASGFWRQHPYEGRLSKVTATIPLEEGQHTINIETSGNAAGNTGSASVTVTLSKEKVPVPGGDNTSSSETLTSSINLYFPDGLQNFVEDEIVFWQGVRGMADSDAVLKEVFPAQPTAPTEPVWSGGSWTELRAYLRELREYVSELANYVKALSQWTRTVRALERNPVFHGTVNGFETTITLDSAPRLRDNRIEDLAGTLTYVAGTYTAGRSFNLTETERSSDLFRQMWSEGEAGKMSLNLFVPINLAGTACDSIQAWVTPRDSFPEDPKLSESADQTASLSFSGDVDGIKMNVQVTGLWTDSGFVTPADGTVVLDPSHTDKLRANVTYTLDSGATMAFSDQEFTETGLNTRVFRTGVEGEVEDTVIIDGGGEQPPQTISWTSDLKQTSTSPLGRYVPCTIRISGFSDTFDLNNFAIDIEGEKLSLNRKEDGFVYIEGPSVAIGEIIEKEGKLRYTGTVIKDGSVTRVNVIIAEESKDAVIAALTQNGISVGSNKVFIQQTKLDFYSDISCADGQELPWTKIKLVSDDGDDNLFIGLLTLHNGRSLEKLPESIEIFGYRCVVDFAQLPSAQPTGIAITLTSPEIRGRYVLYKTQKKVSDLGINVEDVNRDDNIIEYAAMDGYHIDNDNENEPDAYYFGEGLKKAFGDRIVSRGIAHPVMSGGTDNQGPSGNGSEINGRPIANMDFWRSGGVEKIVITTKQHDFSEDWRWPGIYADMDHVLVSNPADIFYISGHGERTPNGLILGGNFNLNNIYDDAQKIKTNGELEWLVLSLCHQANFSEGINPYAASIKRKSYPCNTDCAGIAWYNVYMKEKALHGILGFVSDGWSGADFSRKFANNLAKKSVLDAWKDTWRADGWSGLYLSKAGKWPGVIHYSDYNSEALGSLLTDNQSATSINWWFAHAGWDEKVYENSGILTVPNEYPLLSSPDLRAKQGTLIQKEYWKYDENGGSPSLHYYDSTNRLYSTIAMTLEWSRQDNDLRLSLDDQQYDGFEIVIVGEEESKPKDSLVLFSKNISLAAPSNPTTWNYTNVPANTLEAEKHYFWRVRAYSNISGTKRYASWSPWFVIQTR